MRSFQIAAAPSERACTRLSTSGFVLAQMLSLSNPLLLQQRGRSHFFCLYSLQLLPVENFTRMYSLRSQIHPPRSAVTLDERVSQRREAEAARLYTPLVYAATHGELCRRLQCKPEMGSRPQIQI